MIDTITFGMQIIGITYASYWAFKITKEEKS